MTTTTKLNSFAELKDVKLSPGTNVEARKEREFQKTEPVYTVKLYNKLGSHDAVGDAIGVSGASIGNGIRTKSISCAMELAAMGVWLRDHEPKPKPTEIASPLAPNDRIIVLRMKTPQWDILKPYLDGEGVVSKELA